MYTTSTSYYERALYGLILATHGSRKDVRFAVVCPCRQPPVLHSPGPPPFLAVLACLQSIDELLR